MNNLPVSYPSKIFGKLPVSMSFFSVIGAAHLVFVEYRFRSYLKTIAFVVIICDYFVLFYSLRPKILEFVDTKLFLEKMFCFWLTEVDPCARDNGGCEHTCVNENNRPVCQCYEGYQLAADRKACRGPSVWCILPFRYEIWWQQFYLFT